MHFCTLVHLLAFFSLVFTKVVCVVLSSVLHFCFVQILDLKHKINFFSFFSLTFLHSHFFSLSISFFGFLFLVLLLPPCLVMLSIVLSCYLVASSYYLDLLHFHAAASRWFITTQSLRCMLLGCCLVIPHCCLIATCVLPHHYFVTTFVIAFIVISSLPMCCLVVVSLFPCCFVTLPCCLASLLHCIKLPSEPSHPPPPPPHLLLHYLTTSCLVTFLPRYLSWLVFPSSLLFCREELGAWRSKDSNNHYRRLVFYFFFWHQNM